MSIKRIFTILLALTSIVDAFSQSTTIEAKIDSVTILIGQQTHLNVEVTTRRGASVEFPHFKRSQFIVPGVEVLDSSPRDTSIVDGLLHVKKTFTLTSFDEHLYAIPPVKVKVDGKTFSSNTIALKVLTCDVDTLHPEKFYPPKDVQDNPFLWKEWSSLFWLTIVLFILCVVLCWLVVRLKQNKPIIVHVRIVKHVPPHKKALDKMNKLRAEQLNTSDDPKAYYTELTNTLRQYIRERFGFNAMEMTSTEILANLQAAGDEKMLAELRELFMTADLVKFAKYSSLLNEKDMNLVNAINFIDQTKRDEQPTEERIVPELTADESKTRKSRITIKALLWIVGTLIVGIFAYCIYQVYLLLM